MAFKSIETNGLHNVVGAETPKSLYKFYNFLDGAIAPITITRILIKLLTSVMHQTIREKRAEPQLGRPITPTLRSLTQPGWEGKKHLPNKRMT